MNLAQAINEAVMRSASVHFHGKSPSRVMEMPATTSISGSQAAMMKVDPSVPGGMTTKVCHGTAAAKKPAKKSR